MSNNEHEYFQLIEKVGSEGRYQRNIFFIQLSKWFIVGVFILGTSFMLINVTFDCSQVGLLGQDCKNMVCSLKQQERSEYINPPIFKSIASQFGPFYCQKQQALSLTKSAIYGGALIGFLVCLHITDNYGRKFSMVGSWVIGCIGIALISFSLNIEMVAIGLFITGFGVQSSVKIGLVTMSQTMSTLIRQKYSIGLNFSFAIGGILVGLIYFFLKDWRIFTICFTLIPGLLTLVAMIIYIEETPRFLFLKSKEIVYKSLNRIGQINKGVKQAITMLQIQQFYNIKKSQVKQSESTITWLHLFRLRSLRKISIPIALLYFFMNYIYFGPFLVIDQIDLDTRITQIILSGSQLVAYIIGYFIIDSISRKWSGILTLGGGAIITSVLIFVTVPPNCVNCSQKYTQIVLIMIFRFLVGFFYSVMFIYTVQIFPMRARGIGLGVSCACGSLGATTAPLVFGYFISKDINYTFILVVFSLLGVSVLLFLKDTYNQKLDDEIDEFKIKSNQQKEQCAQQNLQHSSNINYCLIDQEGQNYQEQ